MKTLTCICPGQFKEGSQPKPDRKANEAIIRIQRIGICGTDIHAFAGKQPFFTYPRILGHELGGEIAEIDSNKYGLSVGDQVAIVPYLECGKCIACRSGRPNCCCEINVMGVHIDGGMQEFVSVPVDHLIKDNDLELDQLAMVECLSIGAHAVRRAAIKEGEKVLLVGAGPIGLGLSQMAKIAGADLIVMDIDDNRLAFCEEQFGIKDTINAAKEDPRKKLAKLTNGDYPTVVFDCTGNQKSMMDGFTYLAHGGKYILVSLVLADITFNDPEFHKRETTLLSSRNATRDDFEWVIECIKNGSVKTAPMITHHCQFDEVISKFGEWGKPGTGVIKAIVKM